MRALLSRLLGTATSPWVLYNWGKSGAYSPVNTSGSATELAVFPFPLVSNKVPPFPAFLTTTQPALTGNLSGRSLSATLSIEVLSGHPEFIYGGLLKGWNNCPTPANTRFFITDRAGAYDLQDASLNRNAYWWSHDGVVMISESTGLATISATFDPARWSNAGGQYANAGNLEAFTAIITNTRQVGLAFGGGCFFDVGVAVRGGTGAAAFHLVTFSVP